MSCSTTARQRLDRPLYCALFLALSCGAVRAQSLNIDVHGEPAAPSLPLATFGAAAQQYGVWNDWRPATFGQPLLAIDGSPTSALMAMSFQTQPLVVFFTSNPDSDGLTGDFVEAHFVHSSEYVNFTISGLTLGTYDIFTYTGDPNCGSIHTVSIPAGSNDPPQAVQGFARHRVSVTTGVVDVRIRHTLSPCGGNVLDCQGLQLVKLGEATTICSGDGTGAACPCANPGATGRGCAASFEPQGALLSSSGASIVSADDFVLTAFGIPDSGVAYFQGSDAYGGGAGVAFADGLLCAGGTIVRLVTRFASGGQVSYPLAGDTPIGTLGGPQTAGVQRIYQLWYRDSQPGFCTSATFNLTNGVRTVWAP